MNEKPVPKAGSGYHLGQDGTTFCFSKRGDVFIVWETGQIGVRLDDVESLIHAYIDAFGLVVKLDKEVGVIISSDEVIIKART